MKTIQTDDLNDIFIDDNFNIAIALDLKAVQNVCQNACLTLRGEMPLSVLQGIPYFEVVFGAHPNLQLFRKYIISALESVEHVLSVTNFTLNYEDGTLYYSVLINTDYGATILNG